MDIGEEKKFRDSVIQIQWFCLKDYIDSFQDSTFGYNYWPQNPSSPKFGKLCFKQHLWQSSTDIFRIINYLDDIHLFIYSFNDI